MHGGSDDSRLVLALAAPVSGYSFLNSNEVTETEVRLAHSILSHIKEDNLYMTYRNY